MNLDNDPIGTSPAPSSPSGVDVRAPARCLASGPAAGAISLLVLGVLGALAAWRPADKFYASYPFIGVPPDRWALMAKPNRTPEEEEIVAPYKLSGRLRDSGAVIAMLGAAVGALFGFWEGIARRSILRALAGVLLGAALGAGFGWLGGAAGQWTSELLRKTTMDPMVRAMVFHGAAFIVLGLGTGLAVGLLSATGSVIARATGAGMLGGLLAGMLYSPAAAFFIPTSNTYSFVPAGSSSRLLWFGLAGGIIGLLIGMVGHKRPMQTA